MPKYFTEDDFLQQEAQGQDKQNREFLASDFIEKEAEIKPSNLESALRGAAEGLTFNFSDEIEAAAKTGAEALTGQINPSIEAIKDAYHAQREQAQQANAAAEQANPLTYGASNLAGSVLSPANKVGLAVSGGLRGLGAAQNLDLEGLAQTGVGVALGAGGELAGKAISAAAPYVGGLVNKQIPNIVKGAGAAVGNAVGGPLGAMGGYKAAGAAVPSLKPIIQSASEKVEQLLQHSPQALGRFLPSFQQAFQRGGPQAVKANAFVLQQRDPEFRALVGDDSDK